NSFIPRLWASRKIGYLLEEIRLHGESAELKDEVIRLSKEHGILTPYTAFLVEEPGSRPPDPRLSLGTPAVTPPRGPGAYSGAGGVLPEEGGIEPVTVASRGQPPVTRLPAAMRPARRPSAPASRSAS